jgi:hypothetical protein
VDNSILIAIGIPLLLIVCGALARKLVRGAKWQRTDFFLGVELALAAMASALVYLFELASALGSDSARVSATPTKLASTTSFLALTFFLMLWILSTHQDWEKRPQNPRGQVIWLGVITNGVGVGLFAVFVLLVKDL